MIKPWYTQRKLSTILLALAIVAGTAMAAQAATASWDPNTDVDLAGYKLSYGTQSGVHAVVIDVGTATTYAFYPAPGQTYYVVVQAYNTAGELSEKSTEVSLYVPLSNGAPVLAQPANQTSKTNEKVSLALSASDPDGQPLRFAATGLPTGLAINAGSGLITGSVRSAGSYAVTVTVTDGALSASRSFTWTVGGRGNRKTSVDVEATVDAGIEPSPADDYVDVSGDFDGDGRNDLATYRLSTSEWRIWTSGSNFATPLVMVWGEAGDRPTPADYNGDGVTDFAVYRPTTGTWHMSLSGTQTPLAVSWGGAEDTPVAVDHDGDGKADLALIRGGGYDILLSSANYLKSVQVR